MGPNADAAVAWSCCLFLCLLPCSYNRESTYQQPFLPDGARLCINCAKRVPGAAAAQPPESLLDGMTNLFCRWGAWLLGVKVGGP